jgi:hypothetical protein
LNILLPFLLVGCDALAGILVLVAPLFCCRVEAATRTVQSWFLHRKGYAIVANFRQPAWGVEKHVIWRTEGGG